MEDTGDGSVELEDPREWSSEKVLSSDHWEVLTRCEWTVRVYDHMCEFTPRNDFKLFFGY
jgi:hypothetical protein